MLGVAKNRASPGAKESPVGVRRSRDILSWHRSASVFPDPTQQRHERFHEPPSDLASSLLGNCAWPVFRRDGVASFRNRAPVTTGGRLVAGLTTGASGRESVFRPCGTATARPPSRASFALSSFRACTVPSRSRHRSIRELHARPHEAQDLGEGFHRDRFHPVPTVPVVRELVPRLRENVERQTPVAGPMREQSAFSERPSCHQQLVIAPCQCN